jgi:hypothetical protein
MTKKNAFSSLSSQSASEPLGAAKPDYPKRARSTEFARLLPEPRRSEKHDRLPFATRINPKLQKRLSDFARTQELSTADVVEYALRELLDRLEPQL